MIEARFSIVALVESNEQGQLVYRVTEHGKPAGSDEFSSLVASMFRQDVYPALRAGDELTIRLHVDLPVRESERTARFRADGQFEGEGSQGPTPDLLPSISTMDEQFRRQLLPGDVLTVMFRIRRL